MFLLKKDDKDLNVFYNYYWYIQYLTAFMLAVTMETVT